MKALLFEPGKAPADLTMTDNLYTLQKLVDGYIEIINLDDSTVLICNEEGKIIGLPQNMKIPHDILCGTIIVVGVDGDEFSDIPIDFQEWKQLVKEWGN